MSNLELNKSQKGKSMKAIRLLLFTFLIASPFALHSMNTEKKALIYGEFKECEQKYKDDTEFNSEVKKLFKENSFDINSKVESLPILCEEVLEYIDDDEYAYDDWERIPRRIKCLLSLGADPSSDCYQDIASNTFDILFLKFDSDEVDKDCYNEVWKIFKKLKTDKTKIFLKTLRNQSYVEQQKLLEYIKHIKFLLTNEKYLVENPYPDDTSINYIIESYRIKLEPILLENYKSSLDKMHDFTENIEMEYSLSKVYQESVSYIINDPPKKEEELSYVLQKIKESMNSDNNNNPFDNEKGLKIEGESSGIARELCKVWFGLCKRINVVSNDEDKMGIYTATPDIQSRAETLLRLFTDILPNESSQFIEKEIGKITKNVEKLNKIKENAQYLLTEIGYNINTL